MDWREFGLTGMRVPVIGLGAGQAFDVVGKESQAARIALVQQALDLSVNFFDTSATFGEAERVLGATLTGQRHQAFVGTNVTASELPDGHRQIDRALHYFGDEIDLYQVQNLVHWREYLNAFARMKADRQLRASGVTQADSRQFPEIAKIMKSGLVDAISVPYNPHRRQALQELLPLARERQVGVLVIRPFDGGRLLWAKPPRSSLKQFRPFGVHTWAQVILKWIASDPRVSVIVPGTRRASHLAENAAAGNPPWFGRDERTEVVDILRRMRKGR